MRDATDEQDISGRRGGKSATAFRTISEVATDLDVPQHVLRFWETKFNQIKPLKRGGGRRYYRPEDVALLRRVRDLLYTEGYTIKGVQKLFRDGELKGAPDVEPAPAEPEAPPPTPLNGGGHSAARAEEPAAFVDAGLKDELRGILDQLLEVRQLLARSRGAD